MDIRPEYHGFPQMGELRAQRFAAPGILQFLADQAPELRGMHFQQHRLDRADRGRDMESERKPRPIRAMASSGRPPISPQTVAWQPEACACSATMLRARSMGALKGSKRSATRRFSRSLARGTASGRSCRAR